MFGRSRDRFPVVSLDFSVTYSFRPSTQPLVKMSTRNIYWGKCYGAPLPLPLQCHIYIILYLFRHFILHTHPMLSFWNLSKRQLHINWIFHPTNYGLRRVIFSFLLLFTLPYFTTFSTARYSANPVYSLTVNLSFDEEWLQIGNLEITGKKNLKSTSL